MWSFLSWSCLGLSVLPGPECVSFPRLWKFLSIIPSNKFSALSSLSSLSRMFIMWMSVCLVLSQMALKLPSFLNYFSVFLFSFSDFHLFFSAQWFIPLYHLIYCFVCWLVVFLGFVFGFVFVWLCCVACGILVPQLGIEARPLAVKALSPNHWTTTEFPHLIYYWFFYCIFYFSYYILQLSLVLLIFSNSFKLLTVYKFFSRVHWACLFMIITLTLYWVDCLSPLHLVLLQEFYLVPSFGTYSFVASFFQFSVFSSMSQVGWLHFPILEKWPYVEDSFGGQQQTPFCLPVLYDLGTPYVDSMGPSVLVGLTTVGMLVGRAGPLPSWLPGPASCWGCWPQVGRIRSSCIWLHSLGRPEASAGALVDGARSWHRFAFVSLICGKL